MQFHEIPEKIETRGRPKKQKERSEYQDRGGSLFEYLTHESIPTVIINYLKRLQIFDKLTNEKGEEREELQDCCFVNALKMPGWIDEDTLNKIRLRINTRYLTQNKIHKICLEFKIHLKVHNFDLNDKIQESRIIAQTNKKNYLGVDEASAKYKVELNLINNHYF